MSELKVIEQSGERVLLTSQLAESYGSDTKTITRNFQRNSNRYIEGKHYFALTGEALKEFKGSRQFDDSLKYASVLYLWTEKGAFLHAKSLNTDLAWEIYDKLVDTYFQAKDIIPKMDNLSPQLQLLINMELEQNKLKKELIEVKTTVNAITETFLQRDEDWRKSINQMMYGAVHKLNGDYQDLRRRSYELLEQRAHCKLNTRLANLKNRLADSGATKTKINQTNKLDVIESEPRLKEIYTTIVKELSIGAIKNI